MEEKNTMTLLNKQTKALETYNIHTGELVATSGQLVRSFVYSLEIAEAICNLIREGKTLNDIALIEGMPQLHTMYQWRRYHPDFRKHMSDAKKDRAEYFHDKAVEALRDSAGASKEEVPGAKLQFDGFIKLAERGNPEEYNAKPQMLQQSAAPAMIVINTGINREPTTIEVNNEEICISEGSQDSIQSVPEAERTGREEVIEAVGAEIGEEG